MEVNMRDKKTAESVVASEVWESEMGRAGQKTAFF